MVARSAVGGLVAPQGGEREPGDGHGGVGPLLGVRTSVVVVAEVELPVQERVPGGPPRRRPVTSEGLAALGHAVFVVPTRRRTTLEEPFGPVGGGLAGLGPEPVRGLDGVFEGPGGLVDQFLFPFVELPGVLLGTGRRQPIGLLGRQAALRSSLGRLLCFGHPLGPRRLATPGVLRGLGLARRPITQRRITVVGDPTPAVMLGHRQQRDRLEAIRAPAPDPPRPQRPRRDHRPANRPRQDDRAPPATRPRPQ